MGTTTSARDRLTARIAALSDQMLIASYLGTAQKLEAAPQGDDASAQIIVLSIMDIELLKREIPCCLECSVPAAAGWHQQSLHDTGSPADLLANAVTDAAIKAVTR